MEGNSAVIVFARHHFLQVAHFKSKVQPPAKLLVISFSKYDPDFLLPDNFDGGSFRRCAFNKLVHSIVDFLIQNNVERLMVTDLNYPLQNLVFSELRRRSRRPFKTLFYYDGMLNLIDEKILFSEKVKDLVRSFLALLNGYKFTRRKILRSGRDLIKMEDLEKFDSVTEFTKALGKLSFDKRVKKSKLEYLYVVQGHKAIEKDYNNFLANSLQLLEKELNGSKIFLLERPKFPSHRLENYRYIERTFSEETAEEIIMRYDLKGVISTASSALINSKILRPELEIICFDLYNFCEVFPDNSYLQSKNVMEDFGIKVIN